MSETDDQTMDRSPVRETPDQPAHREPVDETAERTSKRNPARSITIVVILLLLVLVVIYALSDRMAPSSSRGVVSANVVQIAPRVFAEVTEVMVDDDAVVHVGDLLFSIDARPFELAVKQAEANLTTADECINASPASLAAAQAALTQARTRLNSVLTDGDRTFTLDKRGIVSVSQGDAARAKVAGQSPTDS